MRMMKPMSCALGCLVFATACVDSTTEDGSSSKTETTKQAVVDPDGPNWLALGGSAFTEQLGGGDGEPNVVAGRFVLDSNPVHLATSGFGQWVVLGEGDLQALDDDAQRVREKRDALSGNTFTFATRIATGWVAGGEDGQLQLLDTAGEPSTNQVRLLNGETLVGADFSGVSYLALGANGRIVPVNATFAEPASPDGLVAFAGADGHSVVSNGDNTVDPAWIAIGANSYVTVNAAGTPSAEIPTLDTSTTATRIGTRIFIGNDDGSISITPYATTLSFTNSQVLDEAVQDIVEGPNEHLVIGVTGKIRTIDSTGTPVSTLTEYGAPIVGAHGTESGWWLVGEDSVARLVNRNLTPAQTLASILDGAALRAATVGAPGVLAIGEGGAYQLLDETGSSITVVNQLGGEVNDVSWNGTSFLVVGDGGSGQLIDDQGNTEGDAQTYLDGDDVEFAAWSGSFWLVGGGGKVQLVRDSGAPQANPMTVDSDAMYYDAQWEGSRWLVVGERNGVASYALISPDDNVDPIVEDYAQLAKFNVVEFDGREWIAGAANGQILRVGRGGQPNETPITVLDQNEILSIHFNGANVMVGGKNGAVRRVGADFVPLRTALSVIGGSDVTSVLWSEPRGFPGGSCLNNESCYGVPCVGGLVAGTCCDRPCDKACESCSENQTGEPDGTCAPVVAGRRPPSGNSGCSVETEDSCGRTGFCDGAGECQLYGDDVQCAEAACNDAFEPASFCDGAGACTAPAAVDCHPYLGCSSDSGCATSCAADDDCVSGYECNSGVCEEIDEVTTPPTTEDDGGCATTPSNPPTAWLVLLVLGLLIRRRTGR